MNKNQFILKEGIFKENDIRGKYPEEINSQVAFILGKVFTSILKKLYKEPLKLVIGYDNRKSSPILLKSLIKGCLLNKCKIINIKETTTPLFYFSLKKVKATGGIMITASHNPYNENGFLFYLKDGISFLSKKKWDKKFKELVFKEWDKENKGLKEKINRGEITYKNFKKDYLSFLKKFIKIKKPLKFVLDDGGGSAGFILSNFIKIKEFKNLKFYLIKGPLYRFSNPLEKRGLKKLKREILKRKAGGGAAFDSDADRIIFFDEKGNFIEPSKIFALLVLNFLRKDKNFRFVTTEFLNQKIKEKIQKEKGKLVYSPTGYGYFYLKMREEKAVFGSEHTGHFYFKDFDYHDDGLITLILVLNLLSLKEKPFSQIIDEFETNPSFFMNFKSLSLKSFYVLKYLEEIARKYKVKTFENLKIITKDWLIIVRISGTSNLIRFYLEKL